MTTTPPRWRRELRGAGLRVEVDDRAESVGRKIRDGELRKVPYLLVVGDHEAEAGAAGRSAATGEGDLGAVSVRDFAEPTCSAAVLDRT